MLQISINFEEFQLVLYFCTIFDFNTISFNSQKIELRLLVIVILRVQVTLSHLLAS